MRSDLFFDFFRHYLFSYRAGAVIKKIAWLSVVGLFVSVSALIVVMSVMTALNTSIRIRTLAVEPHLTLEFNSLQELGPAFEHPESLPITQQILKLDKNAQVDAFESQDVILRTLDGHFHGAIARGVSIKSYHHLINGIESLGKETKHPTHNAESDGPMVGEVDIGVDLARNLGIFEGDAIMVVPPEGLLLPPSEAPPFERVRIRRILSTNLADVDGTTIFYRRGYALTQLKDTSSRHYGLEAWLTNPGDAAGLKEKLGNMDQVKISTWQEKNSDLFFALKMEKSIILLFLSMATLVAGFSLVTVLTLLTNQKRREIGILQTIGLSQKRVKNLFSSMGYGLAILGGGGGLITGLALSLYLQSYPLNILPDLYYDTEIPAEVDWKFTFCVVGVASLFALWGASAASGRVARERIATSLRAKA